MSLERRILTVDVGQRSKGKESQPAAPFTIRGHHLAKFAYLLSKDLYGDPSRPAELTASRNRYYYTYEEKDRIYSKDVIGVTEADATAYEMRVGDVFERFMSLPGDAKVEIVARRDELCKCCYKGDHCKETGGQHDKRNMHSFVQFAQRIKNEDGINTEACLAEEIYDIDGQGTLVELPKVITTADTVMWVLAEYKKVW